MTEQKLTVLFIDTDACCDPETGVCAVPAARAKASAGAPDGPAPADGSNSTGSATASPDRTDGRR